MHLFASVTEFNWPIFGTIPFAQNSFSAKIINQIDYFVASKVTKTSIPNNTVQEDDE